MLQFEVQPAGERVAQPRAQRDRRIGVVAQQRLLDDAVTAAGQRDQAVGAAVEIVEPQPRVAFATTQLRGRDQPGEVPKAALIGRDEDQPRGIGRDFFGRPGRPAGPDRFGVGSLEGEFRPAQRRERRPDRRFGEPDGAVEPVPIGERDPAQPQAAPLLDELLRVRRPLEEAEVRPAVEFGILGRSGHRTPSLLEHTFDFPPQPRS